MPASQGQEDFIWHPFTQMADWEKDAPLIVERGEGNYLIDTEGRRYFDGVSSLWVNLFGHRRREIDEAIRSQLDLLAHSTFLGLSHVPAIELAEKLLAVSPPGLSPCVLFGQRLHGHGDRHQDGLPVLATKRRAGAEAGVYDATPRRIMAIRSERFPPEGSTFSIKSFGRCSSPPTAFRRRTVTAAPTAWSVRRAAWLARPGWRRR